MIERLADQVETFILPATSDEDAREVVGGSSGHWVLRTKYAALSVTVSRHDRSASSRRSASLYTLERLVMIRSVTGWSLPLIRREIASASSSTLTDSGAWLTRPL